jgi:hypothetical protein
LIHINERRRLMARPSIRRTAIAVRAGWRRRVWGFRLSACFPRKVFDSDQLIEGDAWIDRSKLGAGRIGGGTVENVTLLVGWAMAQPPLIGSPQVVGVTLLRVS